MRNKVLIVDADPQTPLFFEQALEEIVAKGGELLITSQKEEGLALLWREKPQILFLEVSFIGTNEEEWLSEGSELVIMGQKGEKKRAGMLLKPLKASQVLERCREVLSFEDVSLLPPI